MLKKFILILIIFNIYILNSAYGDDILKGFDAYEGENINYSTGEKFYLTSQNIKFIRSISFKKYSNQHNTLVLLESGDEVLNYVETSSYFKGSYINITFGGDHSYSSLGKNLENIKLFLNI